MSTQNVNEVESFSRIKNRESVRSLTRLIRSFVLHLAFECHFIQFRIVDTILKIERNELIMNDIDPRQTSIWHEIPF